MKYIVTLIFLCITIPAYGLDDSEVIYQIIRIHEKSDFNYALIDDYEKTGTKWGETENVIKLFKPIKGNHRIIIFRATFWGLTARETTELLHDILALKVDENNIIEDGLQYTLEMAEPPLALDLYRLKSHGIRLKKGLKLSDLKFQNFLDSDRPPKGVLDNVYNFKEQF